MKINILYEFRDGPYGGVNQFLKALKVCIEKNGLYTDYASDADIILFNSSNNTREALEAKKRYPDKIFVQRMDGPTRLYNNMKDTRDLIANTMNELVADATVFQTVYSREANYTMGLKHNKYETTIMNAPDEFIFNKDKKIAFENGHKIRLIASSWSSNWNKGFEVYDYLDKNLDFNKYEMTFVGNSPVKFKNIKTIPPLNSIDLSLALKQHDIYVTASKKDPCSNALIEALFCGLPAVALNDGGHPEILQSAGEVFNTNEEAIKAIDTIVDNYIQYQKAISLQSMDEIAGLYIKFFEMILEESNHVGCKLKHLSFVKYTRVRLLLFAIKMKEAFYNRIVRKRNANNG
ncbi:MAG: glycosyltransferase [Candidatus Absconditabacteria bacterium]|nr:glycosyltransferase [Candidatus Absconditabacteria bacterium]